MDTADTPVPADDPDDKRWATLRGRGASQTETAGRSRCTHTGRRGEGAR
ncbi:DUF6380 family protein [Streptomyces thermospinosisporus]